MARVELTETVLRPNAYGVMVAISGLPVTINVRGAGAATLYAAATGGTTIAQPLTTRHGRIEPTATPGGDVWLEAGSYDVIVDGRTQRVELGPGGGSGDATGIVAMPAPTGVAATDQAALQAALTAVQTAGFGKVVGRPGTYRLNAAPTWPTVPFEFAGAGKLVTVFEYTNANQLGSDVWGWVIPSLPDERVLRDFTLKGPNNAVALGSSPSNMHGILCGSKVVLQDVLIHGFKSGLGVSGDHQRFTRVRSVTNLVNVDYVAGATTFGNQSYIDCDFGGAKLASVEVDGTSIMEGVIGVNTHFGYAPFGLIRRDTTGITKPILNGCEFVACPIEQVGNCLIYSPNDGADIIPVGTTHWNGSGVGYTNATYRLAPNTIAAGDSTYAINMSRTGPLQLTGGWPETPGTTGYIYAQWDLSGLVWDDIPSAVFTNASTTVELIFSPASQTMMAASASSHGRSRRYVFRQAGFGAVNAKEIVKTPGGGNTTHAVSAVAASALDRSVVGVTATQAADQRCLLVQTWGPAQIKNTVATGINQGGTLLKPSAANAGHAIAAAAVTDAEVVGHAIGPVSSGEVACNLTIG